MLDEFMTQDEAMSALLASVFSGAIGSLKGKGVGYALIEATPTTFSYLSYYLKQLTEAIFAATGHHLTSSTRFTDGALSISYRVTVQERSDVVYVLQPRHHGSVASMDAFMTLILSKVNSQVLPVPPAYPIPGEKKRQEATGMGRKITRLILGVIASSVYPRLTHEERLIFVRKMALAFQACWRIQLPEDYLIGELIAATTDGRVVLKIGPDRHCSLSSPFRSIREYLRAYIRSPFLALEKQQGVEDYKERFLERIKDFVENRMRNIPAIVEDVPIVAMHADMGLHNVIFVSSAPYASLHRIIETLFRKLVPNGFGLEYSHAEELREAFWNAIPEWERWNRSEAARVFLDWYRFGLFTKPEWRPRDLSEDEKQQFWCENIRVVEGILKKYS
ncbi:hypothetical protein GGR51DRAFT_576126 [Nemania sp. FL0031]|nr:hypothetical protein GGR51DRAFT_576126 [Nemania sp. FL0031]